MMEYYGRSPFSIEAISRVVGEDRLDLRDVVPDFERVASKTGIRHVYQTARSAADLAIEAGKAVLQQTDSKPTRFGALIVVTQSPDYLLPGLSSYVHQALSLPSSIVMFDINQGCSGFVQGMIIANSFVTKSRDVLLICTDTYRRKLAPGDRSTSSIFSDGATATILTASKVLKIVAESHYSDGGGARFLNQPIRGGNVPGHLHMSGKDVLLFTKKVVANQIRETVTKAKLRPENIDTVYPHQASLLVLDGLKNSLSDFTDVRIEVERHGNLVSSSIPFILADDLAGLAQKRVVLSGFGVGLSSSTVVVGPDED